MLRKLGFKGFVAAVAAFIGLQAATPAQAAVTVWKFTGTCFDCVAGSPGTPSTATGTLTLDNYTAGTALTAANYVSFSYSSLVFPTLNWGAITTFGGTLSEGFSDFYIGRDSASGPNYFGTSANSAWSLIRQTPEDVGIFGTWAIAAVPESATWAMMLVGFGALGAALRRPRRVSAYHA